MLRVFTAPQIHLLQHFELQHAWHWKKKLSEDNGKPSDGDDNDDDDGDAGAMDCTTVHCTDNTEDKKLIGLSSLDDPRPIQL